MAREYAKGRGRKTRINQYISSSGLCSRREADRLIEEGRVRVDGKTAVKGMRVSKEQRITVGKREIVQENKLVALAVNKPRGVVCTEDKRVKNNIIRFLKYPSRITYIGRLDKDSEGLLLMTNDGRLINRLLRAKRRHEREYKVTVDRPVTEEFLEKLRAGVHIIDKEKGLDAVTLPCKAQREGKYKFCIVLTQGLNRQIRRMCEAFGYQVRELKRVRIANIELGGLKTGEYRSLSGEELDGLYERMENFADAAVRGEPYGRKENGAHERADRDS